jgi:hypothetical protein
MFLVLLYFVELLLLYHVFAGLGHRAKTTANPANPLGDDNMKHATCSPATDRNISGNVPVGKGNIQNSYQIK